MQIVVALVPAPLETIRLTPALDGRQGVNRASGHAQIAADNDLDAIRAWLARFADTRTTLENYRKEAERLMLWSVCQLQKPISSLSHEDLLIYQRFLTDPQPSEHWVSAGSRKFAREDPRWRPFYGPLAPSSQRQAMVILNAMFSWLVQAGYLAGNPLALSRQRAARASPRQTRYLEPALWQDVKAYIVQMPQESAREQAHQVRVRWLFTLLYLGGLRISEVVENTMSAFFCRRDSGGRDRWWLEVCGKGGKVRLVPATQEMMLELTRYRKACGLTPYPGTTEMTPLILPLGQSREPLSRAALHATVKSVFLGAAQRLRASGEQASEHAALLEKASAHWLRHTAGSAMADGNVDLRIVRDNLGHESISTTSRYLHTDDDRRHRETEEKHRIDW